MRGRERGSERIIAGDPGIGKSQLSINVFAAATTGGQWPCGEGRAPLGNVIILSAEDGVADTLVPRLLAAGADLKRVRIVRATKIETGNGKRSFDLANDLALLEKEIADFGNVILVGIDPVTAYVGKANSFSPTEVRNVLEPVCEMAKRLHVGILSITHCPKGSSTGAIYRFIGSISFVGVARIASMVVPCTEIKGRILFLGVKTNIGPIHDGLAARAASRDHDRAPQPRRELPRKRLRREQVNAFQLSSGHERLRLAKALTP
jgi:putative DNA primase/helicase